MKEIPQEMKFLEPLLREVSETIKQNAMLEMKAARQKELKLFAESAWNPMVENVKDLTDAVNSLSPHIGNGLLRTEFEIRVCDESMPQNILREGNR